MIALSLAAAWRVLGAATAKCAELRLKPMAVAILDARGCLKAFAAQDGTSLLRAEVAHGKAHGALALGMGSRAILKRGSLAAGLTPGTAPRLKSSSAMPIYGRLGEKATMHHVLPTR